MKKTRIFSVVLVVLVSVLVLSSCSTTSAYKASEEDLSLWTDSAPAKEALISFMEAVTDPSNPDYIPPENRIAVFDFDGTLFCETDTNYFDHTLLVYRVLQDEEYSKKAGAFEKQVANEIVERNKTSVPVSGMDVPHGQAVASAFKGMTTDEFTAYIQEFKKIPMPGYYGMNRGDGFYLPMLQVVSFLQENGFTVFIVSGTDRFIVRGLIKNSPLDCIHPSNVIGSDESVVATGQGDTAGLEYQFKLNDDEVVTGGEFLLKTLKMNKVALITREIGLQPVLSFGNSTGDSSMADYTLTDNPYRSLAFMLCCDDLVRENGNEEKAQNMKDLCALHGWIAVSMRDDWTTIYGDGVTRK